MLEVLIYLSVVAMLFLGVVAVYEGLEGVDWDEAFENEE